MTRETAGQLVRALTGWMGRLWPDPERGQALAAELDRRFGSDGRAVDAGICREVEAAAHPFSRHFALELRDRAAAPDETAPGWPAQSPREVRERGGSVREVSRRPDGVAVLALDGLDTAHLAAPYLEAAFALCSSARAVVVDLRRNGGGDPATLTLLLDWVLGPPPRHVSDVVYRDRTRQWWTAGRPAACALPPGTPVAVATSGRTFSSGEALAYHLQHLCGAVVVGEGTRGAADHITPVRVTPHVTGYLPEAYVRDATTGRNWEGTGVRPDVPCAEDAAVDTAARLLLDPAGRRPPREAAELIPTRSW